MVICLALLLVLAIVWRLRTAESSVASFSGGEGARPGSVAVEVSPIARRDLQETRGFTGTLEAESRFDVNARLAGRLVSLEADIGDRVRRDRLERVINDLPDDADRPVSGYLMRHLFQSY